MNTINTKILSGYRKTIPHPHYNIIRRLQDRAITGRPLRHLPFIRFESATQIILESAASRLGLHTHLLRSNGKMPLYLGTNQIYAVYSAGATGNQRYHLISWDTDKSHDTYGNIIQAQIFEQQAANLKVHHNRDTLFITRTHQFRTETLAIPKANFKLKKPQLIPANTQVTPEGYHLKMNGLRIEITHMQTQKKQDCLLRAPLTLDVQEIKVLTPSLLYIGDSTPPYFLDCSQPEEIVKNTLIPLNKEAKEEIVDVIPLDKNQAIIITDTRLLQGVFRKKSHDPSATWEWVITAQLEIEKNSMPIAKSPDKVKINEEMVSIRGIDKGWIYNTISHKLEEVGPIYERCRLRDDKVSCTCAIKSVEALDNNTIIGSATDTTPEGSLYTVFIYQHHNDTLKIIDSAYFPVFSAPIRINESEIAYGKDTKVILIQFSL